MFCPLCKAEYRQGFSTCSDCHIPLVATQAEAEAVAVDRLWNGDNRRQFGGLLDALLDAAIPLRSRGFVKSQPGPWISIPLFGFMDRAPRLSAVLIFFTAIAVEQTRPFLSRKVTMILMMNNLEGLTRLTYPSRACFSLFMSMEMKNVDRVH